MDDLDLTVCICTRDRPDSLESAISSVVRNAPDAEIVVSDDGRDRSAASVAARFPRCRWQPGPARGLCANRNAAVRSVTSEWLIFLDDDAELGTEFVASATSLLASFDADVRGRLIVTGRERKDGRLVLPNDVDFLGFQRRPYQPGNDLRTVIINATLWPKSLFNRVQFDEHLLYGSDEVDLTYAALAAGYRIEECPDAVNDHHPSELGREGYAANAHAARLRATLKRHWRMERSFPRTALFIVIAPIHLLAACLKQEGARGLVSWLKVLRQWLSGARAK